MNFYQRIKNSIYSPEFYSQISQKSWKNAFGYFFILILLLTALQSLFLLKPIFIDLPNQISGSVKSTIGNYPSELEVKIENGKVSSNAKEPFYILIPDTKDNLIVIDTQTPYSAQKFSEYNTIAWVGRDTLFYQGSTKNEVRTMDMSKIGNITISRKFVSDMADKISPWIRWVGPIVFIFTLLGLYLSLTFKLIYLLLLAFLIMFVAKISNNKLTYSQSYKTGLYALTLGLIVDSIVIVTQTYTHFSGFPFMFTLITLGVAFLNLNSKDTKNA